MSLKICEMVRLHDVDVPEFPDLDFEQTLKCLGNSKAMIVVDCGNRLGR